MADTNTTGLSNYLTRSSQLIARLNTATRSGLSINEAKVQQLNAELATTIQSMEKMVDEIEEVAEENDSVIQDATLSTVEDNGQRYGIGETCLLLDPFDNYRMFRLYSNNDERVPLNISDGQQLYLVFGVIGKGEVRIPEYESIGTYIDKTNGEVLFKITKKNATDIFALNNKTFYITRIYKTYDYASETEVSSAEEVIYSGYWGDRNTTRAMSLTTDIKTLQQYCQRKDAAIIGLENTLQTYMEDNINLSNQVVELNEEVERVQNMYDDLCEELNKIAPGFVDAFKNGEDGDNSAVLLDSKTILLNYENADDDTKNKLDGLIDNLSNDLLM